MEELLAEAKLLIGIPAIDTTHDALLTLYLKRGTRTILTGMPTGKLYNEVPMRYQDLLLDAVVTAYNQQGAEGNKATASNGTSYTWSNSGMDEYIRSRMPANPVIA